MESVDYFDKYLDPPEPSSYLECDGCGKIFDYTDLWKIGGICLCDNCLEKHKTECDFSNE